MIYVYGRCETTVEQINNTTGAVEYLHHDQAGSTRLITGSTGKTEATFTYGPYGELTGSTGTATTPLGYDAQYTSSDTGLIYLRARTYDPATGQFLSVDPKVEQTSAVYTYAQDNPLAGGDPTGECPTASAAAFQGGTKSECEKLLNEIVTKRSVVLKRVQELLEDRQKLPLSEIKSHIKALKQAQTSLRKLLNKFDARQCTEEWGLELPADVYEVLEIEVHIHIVVAPVP
jgi:RHS repeat-associated protein